MRRASAQRLVMCSWRSVALIALATLMMSVSVIALVNVISVSALCARPLKSRLVTLKTPHYGARWWVDQALQGLAPLKPLPLSLGLHHVKLTDAQGRSVERVIWVTESTETSGGEGALTFTLTLPVESLSAEPISPQQTRERSSLSAQAPVASPPAHLSLDASTLTDNQRSALTGAWAIEAPLSASPLLKAQLSGLTLKPLSGGERDHVTYLTELNLTFTHTGAWGALELMAGQAPLVSPQKTQNAQHQHHPPPLTLSSVDRVAPLSPLARLGLLWGRGGGLTWRKGGLSLSARGLEARAWSVTEGEPLVGALTIESTSLQGSYQASLYSLNLRGGLAHAGLVTQAQRTWSAPQREHTLSAHGVVTSTTNQSHLSELSVGAVSAWGAPTLTLSGRWARPHPLTQLVAPWAPWPQQPLEELTHLNASLTLKREGAHARALTVSVEAQEGGALTWMSDALSAEPSARVIRGLLSAELSTRALPQLSLTPSIELWAGAQWGERVRALAGELSLSWRPSLTQEGEAQGVTLWGGVSPLGRWGGGARLNARLIGLRWEALIERPRLISDLLAPPSQPSGSSVSPLWRALLSLQLPWRALRSSRASP